MMAKPHDLSEKGCPSNESLRAFTQGRLAPDSSDLILQHLDACPRCEQKLESLDSQHDSLIESIREALSTQDATAEPGIEALSERVNQIALPIGQAYETTTPGQPGGPTETLKQLGPYRLDYKLGAGGMGAVYKAFHLHLKRIVAVKLLPKERSDDPRFVKRFYGEMAAIGNLKHPNIVHAYDAGEANGRHFIAMEFVDGKDLSAVLRRSGRLTTAEACTIALQVAEALTYIHGLELVHRDLKPSNLLLAKAGKIKIVDLGLAKLVVPDADGSDLTGSHQIIGTADYVAPEQTKNERKIDVRADIYSLGCTLFKLLTGQAPFSGPKYSSIASKLVAHCTSSPPSIQAFRDDVPEPVSAAIEKMMAKSPRDRFQNPQELIDALRPFAESQDLSRLVKAIQTDDSLEPDPRAVTATMDTDEDDSADTLSEPRQQEEPVRRLPRWAVPLFAAAIIAVLTIGGRHLLNRQNVRLPEVDPEPPPVVELASVPAGEDPLPPAPANPPPDPTSKTFENLLANEVEPLRWYHLLNQEPVRLLWPERSEVSMLNLDRARDQLFVQTTDAAVLQFGMVHSPNYIFSVDVYQGRWSGGVGVIFGIVESWDQGVRKIKYQSIRLIESNIRNKPARYYWMRSIERVEFEPGKPPYPSGSNIASVEIERPPPSPQAIEITVRTNRLRQVRFGGKELPELLDRPGESELTPENHVGPFGVYVGITECSFRNARVMLLESAEDTTSDDNDSS